MSHSPSFAMWPLCKTDSNLLRLLICNYITASFSCTLIFNFLFQFFLDFNLGKPEVEECRLLPWRTNFLSINIWFCEGKKTHSVTPRLFHASWDKLINYLLIHHTPGLPGSTTIKNNLCLFPLAPLVLSEINPANKVSAEPEFLSFAVFLLSVHHTVTGGSGRSLESLQDPTRYCWLHSRIIIRTISTTEQLAGNTAITT